MSTPRGEWTCTGSCRGNEVSVTERGAAKSGSAGGNRSGIGQKTGGRNWPWSCSLGGRLIRILRDVRYSARSFIRAPAPSLALLCTIAVGIGGNVSIEGFARGFGRSEAPRGADGLVSVGNGPVSATDFARWKTLGVFERLGAARITSGAITIGGQTSIGRVAAVTAELAHELALATEEGIAIGRPGIESIVVDGVETRIGGVAPEGLDGLTQDRPVDVWMPLREESPGDLWVVGRLRGGVSLEQAQAAVQTRVAPYTGMPPDTAAGVARIAALLRWTAAALLFIACGNVAAFLLGRAVVRSHETSLRVALGAGLGQLARQSIADSMVISAAGGAFGTVLALWIVRTMPTLLYEGDAQRLMFAPALPDLALRSAVCVGVTILSGLLPLFFTPHNRPGLVLRRQSAGPSKTMRRLRLALVAAQMASCCVLVVGTAYLFDGFAATVRTSAGRRLGNAMVVGVVASPLGGGEYYRRVEEAARAVPGIVGVTWAGRLPGGQPTWQTFRVEPPGLALREVAMDIGWLTAESLKRIAAPPKAGRMFGFGDSSCRVAVANAAAQRLFGEWTVGRTLHDGGGQPIEMIGVVEMRPEDRQPTIYYDGTAQTGTAPAPVRTAHFQTPSDAELARAELDVNVVSENYFDAMGISLAAGQGLEASGSCRVGVVNRQVADLYFAGRAIGGALIDVRGQRTAIVGVVDAPPLGVFQRRADPAVYLPMRQNHLAHMRLIAGGSGDSERVAEELRRRLLPISGGGLAPTPILPLEAHLRRTALAPLRIAMLIVGASAALSLLLCGIGLFGALSDAARQRRREVAVRIALGAQRWRVMGQVLEEGAWLGFSGTATGSAAAVLLSRGLAGLLPASAGPPLWVWLAAPAALFTAIALASVLPARRASMINPLSVLREEN
jgi:hypothetical protein